MNKFNAGAAIMADDTKASKPSEQPYDTESEESFDAKVLNEEIQEGEQNAPKVDVENDYAASKKLSEPADNESSKGAGNPDSFRDMAKQVKRK
ncbi:hypothetical protein C7B61_18820 [filamentous cyanobacterium CCP1]|nr:hypothetical protein C7B76_28330 [filamentous cyanobacterium CCP2]PSB59557.1 hypothetical protein C7B61_18820 [filamentous cyanobacterium CCP1]